MKLSTENSLKRFLKRKVKITLGLVVAFMITGTVGFAEEIAVDKETIINVRPNTDEIKAIVGINANKLENGNGQDYKNENSIEINYKEETAGDKWIAGIFANNGGEVNLSGETININLSTKSDKDLKGVAARNEGKVNGTATGGKIYLGEKGKTKDVVINVHSDNGFVSGLEAHRRNGDKTDSSYIEVNSENLMINASSNWQGKVDDNGAVYAIFAQGTGATNDREISKIVINSENTIINSTAGYSGEGEKYAKSFGIVAFSNSSVEINGNLEINADTVLVTRGESITKINAEGKNTVKLNGDIEFNYDEKSSGTTIEAGVLINLSNENSYLNGKIIPSGNAPENKDDVTGMKLGLSNGGTWNVTGDSFVNDLTVDNGIINVTDKVEKEISVDKLQGNGGTVTFETTVNGNEIDIAKGKLNIDNATNSSRMRVGFSGTNADELIEKNVNLEEAFNQLADKVTVTTGNVEETYFAQEGAVVGEITAVESKDGKMEISQEKSSNTVAGLRDLATINYLSWKQEMGSLTQRMGELRNSSAEHGVWARVYGGKVENGSRYDNEYQTYQVGYDKKYSVNNGNVFLGYLVSYTDGETNYELGSGENYSVGAGMYATWVNNNGHYVDVLYKVSRLNNKFDVNGRGNNLNSKGEYDTYGISLSGEYGKRFDLTEKWFIEPNVGMHFGRLGNETYTTNSGIEVSQDSIYTAEGRIGTSVGYKFGNGNVYARAHAVKEFAGDIDSSYTANGVTVKESEDLSDTWLEFGVGTNYRFAENVNVYLDLEKSGDAAVDTEWQANLGFRWEF